MATKGYMDIVDRTVNSLQSIQKGEWYDTMQTYQDYPILRVMKSMGKEKSGKQLSFRIGVGSEGEDGHSGLYEDYDVDRPNVMTEGTRPWVNHRKGFGIDTRELDPMSAPESIIDDMEVQHNDLYSQIADDLELQAWNVPSTSEALLPSGMPYYVVHVDSADGTFTTGAPSGHSTVAGITPTVQTKYQNYGIKYTNFTRDDFGLRVSRALRQTNWRPPEKVRGDQKVTHAMYTVQAVIEGNEQMAANQNDQLGPDTQPMWNKSMLARIGLTWVPALEDQAAADSDPLYIINHAYLKPAFKVGLKFHEVPARPAPKQPLAVEVSVWTTYQWECQLRNRQAVAAKAAPFGEW